MSGSLGEKASRGSGPASAEVAWKLKSWGSQMDLVDEFESGSALSLAQLAESKDCVFDPCV